MLQFIPLVGWVSKANFNPAVMLVYFWLLFLVAHTVSSKDVPVPKYTINLDVSPEERWKDVATDFKDEIHALFDRFKQMFPLPMGMIDIMGADLEQYFPMPYASEMKSFVTYSNITGGQIVFWNMLYELTAFSRACTSIVSKTASGNIMHGRNLDYGIDVLRRLAITVDFQLSGKTVYTGTTFAGYVGIMTGQKPNSFTVSLNEREKGYWSLNEMEALRIGTKGFAAFSIRDMLADPEADFEKVVAALSSIELIAPCYIILGGLNDNEGAVITHNRSMGIDIWRLNSTESKWYLVETNYDHWNRPPSNDNRRDPATNMIGDIGQDKIDVDSLYKILSTPPVLNYGTIFTVVMSASNSTLYSGWIRDSSK